MVSRKTKNLTSLGLTVGVLSGAVAAYFLAPQKGTDTQKMLVRKANNIAQKSIYKVQDALIRFEVTLAKTEESKFR